MKMNMLNFIFIGSIILHNSLMISIEQAQENTICDDQTPISRYHNSGSASFSPIQSSYNPNKSSVLTPTLRF